MEIRNERAIWRVQRFSQRNMRRKHVHTIETARRASQ
jgi:hypothetical protein